MFYRAQHPPTSSSGGSTAPSNAGTGNTAPTQGGGVLPPMFFPLPGSGAGGGAGGGVSPQEVNNQLQQAEVMYQSQLEQMQNMGFPNRQANLNGKVYLKEGCGIHCDCLSLS